MKASDMFLILATVIIAPHISKGWALLGNAGYLLAFALSVYLERFA